jgi:glutamine amidotransferase
MCRHLGHLGPSRPLGELLLEPPYSLYRQSWAPRRQRHGTVNADGFGVGWYADGDPVPARYRRAGPIWADGFLPDLCRVVGSTALLAAVRDATTGCAAGESAAAPYADGSWLFSHNGALTGWPASMAHIAASLPPQELLDLEARCDSALAWALVRHRLRAGSTPEDALAGAAGQLSAAAPGSRLNFLLTDGRTLAATACGDTLWYLLEPGTSLTVASEPHDTGPGWRPVPDTHLLTGDAGGIELTALA